MKGMILLVSSIVAMSACQQHESHQVAALATAPAGVPATPSQTGVPSAVPVAEPARPSSALAVASVPEIETPAPVNQPPAPVKIESAVVAVEMPFVKSPTAKPVTVVTPPVVVKTKPAVGLSDIDVVALAKKKNCFACHMIDKRVVGPSWKEVATKYRGDAAAQSKLENKIAKGGSGAWGNMAMPPQPQVNEAERTSIVRFILNLK